MKAITIMALFLFSLGLSAQEISDQNPNHQKSYEKYLKTSESYTKQQGTTAQQTYVAIDPMEERRVRKKMRRDHRAMSRLWRHQERMEEARNTRYRVYNNGWNSRLGWNNGWNTNIGWGLNFGRGFSINSGFNRPFFRGSNFCW